MTHARQFALPFPLSLPYRAADFLAAPCNEAALAWIGAPAAWPAGRLIAHGGPGTGKTHLLHLFAERAGAALLPAAALRGLLPPPDAPALAIDDAECAPDERALLHVLNAAAERGLPVLLSAGAPPARWGTVLPDLASRLRASGTVEVLPPDDALLRALLARLFAERQLAVAVEVQEFLLARLPRTGAALREVVARIDRLALAEGRRIGRGVAAVALESLAADLAPDLRGACEPAGADAPGMRMGSEAPHFGIGPDAPGDRRGALDLPQ